MSAERYCDMSEKPILFSREMVQAIRDGRKTQTRLIGSCQKDDATELGVSYIGHTTKGMVALATYRAFPNGGTARWGLCECPYGIPGDRLWVKETHIPKRSGIIYRADFDQCKDLRISLEIVSLRAERLQGISGQDAQAEGWPREQELYPNVNTNSKAQEWYQRVWEQIHGAKSWSANPWVWVVIFKHPDATEELKTPATSAPASGSALVGRCTRCFAVNAIDLDNTPENRLAMEMPGRRGISVVTHDEAVQLSSFLKRCGCFAPNVEVGHGGGDE